MSTVPVTFRRTATLASRSLPLGAGRPETADESRRLIVLVVSAHPVEDATRSRAPRTGRKPAAGGAPGIWTPACGGGSACGPRRMRGRPRPTVGVPGRVYKRVPVADVAVQRGVELPGGAHGVASAVEQQPARRRVGDRHQVLDLGRIGDGDRRAGVGTGLNLPGCSREGITSVGVSPGVIYVPGRLCGRRDWPALTSGIQLYRWFMAGNFPHFADLGFAARSVRGRGRRCTRRVRGPLDGRCGRRNGCGGLCLVPACGRRRAPWFWEITGYHTM